MIERTFKDTGIDVEKYLLVCEELGQTPDPSKMPPERGMFPVEVQEAFYLHDVLSDRWDGASGYYMGKDFSALGTYLEVFNILDPLQTLWFLKHIEFYNSKVINDKQEAKRKAEERKLKSKTRK